MAETFDFTDRFFRIVKTLMVVAMVVGIALFAAKAWEHVSAKAKLLSCQNNLRIIGIGLQKYSDNNKNKLPPWITEIYPVENLYPRYVDKAEAFVCPNDRTNGQSGCWPLWLRNQPDWIDELAFADLDGPTGFPQEDEDTVPCSYFYRFNQYPTDINNRNGALWVEVAELDVEKHGKKTPVLQCFWHLKEGTPADEGSVPSLLYDLTQVEIYPRKWRTKFPK